MELLVVSSFPRPLFPCLCNTFGVVFNFDLFSKGSFLISSFHVVASICWIVCLFVSIMDFATLGGIIRLPMLFFCASVSVCYCGSRAILHRRRHTATREERERRRVEKSGVRSGFPVPFG